MCQLKAHIFSECKHVHHYELLSRCANYSWWYFCEAWADDIVPKVKMENIPYCCDCYRAKAKEIRILYAITEQEIYGNKDLSACEREDVQSELRTRLLEELGRLNEQCLGESRQRSES
ncbi:hypothetical protein MMC28_003735 [Mycoblastus sanguinarius]|nr:hypothetical protein [Mycoblastus sanguinarius]